VYKYGAKRTECVFFSHIFIEDARAHRDAQHQEVEDKGTFKTQGKFSNSFPESLSLRNLKTFSQPHGS